MFHAACGAFSTPLIGEAKRIQEVNDLFPHPWKIPGQKRGEAAAVAHGVVNSGTPLAERLGIETGCLLAVVGAPTDG